MNDQNVCTEINVVKSKHFNIGVLRLCFASFSFLNFTTIEPYLSPLLMYHISAIFMRCLLLQLA